MTYVFFDDVCHWQEVVAGSSSRTATTTMTASHKQPHGGLAGTGAGHLPAAVNGAAAADGWLIK